jgi:hypothetical protein
MFADAGIHRMVVALNDYYRRLALIQRKRQMIDTLQVEINELTRELADTKEMGPSVSMVAGYGSERVQSAPVDDPVFQAHIKHQNRLRRLQNEIEDRKDRQWEIRTQIMVLQSGFDEIEVGLDSLEPIQREVVERIHVKRQRTVQIGLEIHVDKSRVSHIYKAALIKMLAG